MSVSGTGSELTLNDEPLASAMASLSTRSIKERMLIGKLLLVMSKTTAEIEERVARLLCAAVLAKGARR
jgi:hypothetical protein